MANRYSYWHPITGSRKTGLIDHNDFGRLLCLGVSERTKLRNSISNGLRLGSPEQTRFEAALLPMSELELGLPCDVGDYTDFYIGIHHATAVGKLFRPANPLLPNYDWVPIGYHGRFYIDRIRG